MYFVFFALIESLLTHNQLAIKDSSLFIESEISLSELVLFILNEHVGDSREVSSAYRIKLNFSDAFAISFIYIMNNNGPRMDP